MECLELRLDDDPETLQTALEMLDAAMESRIDGAEGSTATEDDMADQNTRQIDGLTKSARRKRRPRDDLIELRQRVAQLQSRLIHLRNKSHSTDLLSFFLKQKARQSMWKALASHQRQHRRDAEHENKKLHLMLRSQMMVGQRLLAMLRQDSAKKSASVDVQPCGVQSREEQDRHASELFAQVDQVFGDDVFQNEQSSFYDIRAQSNSKNGSIVDTRAGWIVSCASDQVAEVLWANMTHIKGSMICKRLRMDIESQGDTLLASFTVSATAGSDHGTCTGTSLFRRHHLDDGTVVIVSVMSGQMLGTTSTSRDAITVSEEQVMRIRRVQVTDGETMTQVHITRQLRMSFAADHSTARQSIVNANIERMLLRIEDEITLKQELVEELGR